MIARKKDRNQVHGHRQSVLVGFPSPITTQRKANGIGGFWLYWFVLSLLFWFVHQQGAHCCLSLVVVRTVISLLSSPLSISRRSKQEKKKKGKDQSNGCMFLLTSSVEHLGRNRNVCLVKGLSRNQFSFERRKREKCGDGKTFLKSVGLIKFFHVTVLYLVPGTTR